MFTAFSIGQVTKGDIFGSGHYRVFAVSSEDMTGAPTNVSVHSLRYFSH